MKDIICQLLRTAGVAFSTAAATAMLAGCSSELASFDDTYVPQSIDENFPITVVEQPLKLTLDASAGRLQPADVSEVTQFARSAALRATTPVTVGYSRGSKRAREAANQSAAILIREGIPRQSVLVTPYEGSEARVVLAFGTKMALTKPCGDWSQNLRGNQFNESGPNFGCAFQQNMAAMVADPNDFVRPKPMTPAQSASQSAAMQEYGNGTWTTPIVTSSSTSGQ